MRRPVSTKSVVGQHEQNKNNPRVENPDRLNWPGMRLSEDNRGTTQVPYVKEINENGKTKTATEWLRFRILPEHPTRNPNGYVQQIRYKVYMKGAVKPTYIIGHESLGDGSSCPYTDIRNAFDEKFKEDKDFQDWWDSINMEVLKPGLEEQDPIAVRDALFKKHYLEFCDPWETFFIPALVYASCTKRQKPGTKWEELFNYKPDTRAFATRLVELGNWTATRELLDLILVEETPELLEILEGDDDVAKEEAPVKVNSETYGINMQMRRVKAGEKVGYEIEVVKGAGRTKLPKQLKEKLEPNLGPDGKDKHEHNYPDVLGWKVKKDLKSAKDMQMALLNSTIGEVLIEKGLLSVGELAPADLEDTDDSDVPFDVN